MRYVPWLFAGIGVLVTAVFTICEVTGNSLWRYVPLEMVLGASELAGWLIRGDNAATRGELYVYGFPFGAAWNGFVGWLLGFFISATFTKRYSLRTLLVITTVVAVVLGAIAVSN
jgi:hypothetical protein